MKWIDEAACRGDPDPNTWYASPHDAESRARALSVCARCPVAAECLDDALARDDAYGIWGGVLAEDRPSETVGGAA